MDKKWYIVYTKSGSEKKVSEIFSRKKIESYVPINKLFSDTNKKVRGVPLFKGYVFIKTLESCHEEIKKISDVINLVYWMGKPVTIKSSEIKAIQLFLNEYQNVTLEKTTIKDNSENVKDNRAAEMEAPLITIKNKKAYVGLYSLGYVMIAESEAPNVRIISVKNSFPNPDSKLNKLLNKVSKFDNSFRSN